MRLTKVLKATISKDPQIMGSNEDAAVLRLFGKSQRAAVFDGASESFAARKWSRLLADEWGRGLVVDDSWIKNAQDRYQREMYALSLSWAQEAAMERGSFATIASIEVLDDVINVCIIGDSTVFFLDSRGVKSSLPFQSETQFSSAPLALSSRPKALEQNYALLQSGKKLSGTFSKAIGERFILLATDAVSCWLLSDDLSTHLQRLNRLISCKSPAEFREMVLREREDGAMKIDDSTIILLRID